MIKCIGYLKSLKQLLFTLLISCFIFGLGSFVNGGYIQTIGVNPSPSQYDGNFDITFLKGGGVLSSFLGQGKSVLALTDKAFFWWSTNGIPYYYDNTFQGFFGEYRLCDLLTGNSLNNCVSYPITGDYKGIFTGFFSKVAQGDLAFYDYEGQDIGSSYFDNTIQVCFSSSGYNKTLCFRQHSCYNGHGCSAGNYGSLVNSQNLSGLTFGLINSSWIGSAPGQLGYDGNGSSTGNDISSDGVALDSTQGALDYYENYYGWNSSICYLGVDSMSYLWGATGVSFNQGGGLNIFEGFNQLYSGSDLDHVYVWINSWLINYNNWFNRSDPNEPPLYLVNYDYSNNSVNIYYDNLNFPFTNNPLGVYFMSNYIDSKSSLCDSSCGSDVVSYCNIKLNGGTFEDVIDNSSKDSINQYISQKNIHNGLNSDGTEKTHSYFYVSSGENYTGAVEFINYYVGQLNGLINTNYDGPGFIPAYIILFMLALIFFRFISH